MEKLTYKEFEEIVNDMGCQVSFEETVVFVEKDSILDTNSIVASISKTRMGIISIHGSPLLKEEEIVAIGRLSWLLASTPLTDREEQKRYYLKVCQKYLPFFSSSYEYLNINTHTGRRLIASKNETDFHKTIFTEEEINELAKEYDLSLFEKVEVEDE